VSGAVPRTFLVRCGFHLATCTLNITEHGPYSGHMWAFRRVSSGFARATSWV